MFWSKTCWKTDYTKRDPLRDLIPTEINKKYAWIKKRETGTYEKMGATEKERYAQIRRKKMGTYLH